MKVLFHLGHPAHFHLFKNTIKTLRNNGHTVYILIKKKDVLEDLLKDSGFDYYNILPEGRRDSKMHILLGLLKQNLKTLKFCLKYKPDMLVGTSSVVSHVGFLLNKPAINGTEDDYDVVPLFSKITYPVAATILVPENTRMGKWSKKATYYRSYHELAYLHPNNFTPDKQTTEKYTDVDKPYFIIRFAKLTAHHDTGVQGINNELALKIIEILRPHGKIFITSERKLNDELEEYRVNIDPKDMHHFMAFSEMFIGDSQTMAAESAVLGIPFVRFNDFVGRITYLEELENKYNLGYGIRTDSPEKLLRTIELLIETEDRKLKFQQLRQQMLDEKIDYAQFLTWFIEGYPKSKETIKENPDYQLRFK